MPSPAHAVAPASTAVWERDRPYRLHPKVALRPERFGALAYSYDTRRLSLLKDLDLVSVVRALADQPSAAAALAAVPEPKRAAVERALARLVETHFVVERRAGGAVADEAVSVGSALADAGDAAAAPGTGLGRDSADACAHARGGQP